MSLSSLSTSRPITVLMFYIAVVMLGVLAFFHFSIDSAAITVLTISHFLQ